MLSSTMTHSCEPVSTWGNPYSLVYRYFLCIWYRLFTMHSITDRERRRNNINHASSRPYCVHYDRLKLISPITNAFGEAWRLGSLFTFCGSL